MDITWIRDKLKMLATLLKHNEPACIKLEMIDEYVENQNVQINTLQSDLDEAQKALEDVMNVNDKLRAELLEIAKHIIEKSENNDYYCCDNFIFSKDHDKNCTLPKAERIIKELENEDNNTN